MIMDRILEKKKGWRRLFTRKALLLWAAGAFVLLLAWMIAASGHKVRRVESESLRIGEVIQGEFDDYISVSGTVLPASSVQISPTEGGIVERIVAEEGATVNAGDVIIELSNENLDLQILNSEAELAEKENLLRNTMISMEQQRLSVRQERLQLQVDVRRAKRAYESAAALYAEQLIAREEYLKAEEDYTLAADRLELVREREVQDSLYRSVEITRMEESLENMRANMEMIRRRKDNLSVKAPIGGELGLLDVVLGQSIGSGDKIGQINDLSSFRIEAQISEYYIDRIVPGLEASTERQDRVYPCVLRRVYPEVRNHEFKAEFRFAGDIPENLRSGQTCRLEVRLGASSESVLIPKGGFFQDTGGRWIFVLDPDGKSAHRREVRIGRQNPEYYEVIEGLAPGERVVLDGYAGLGKCDELRFRQ